MEYWVFHTFHRLFHTVMLTPFFTKNIVLSVFRILRVSTRSLLSAETRGHPSFRNFSKNFTLVAIATAFDDSDMLISNQNKSFGIQKNKKIKIKIHTRTFERRFYYEVLCL